MTGRLIACLLAVALAHGCGTDAASSELGADSQAGTFADTNSSRASTSRSSRANSSTDLPEETVVSDTAGEDLAVEDEALTPASPAVTLLEPASGAVVANPVTFRISARGVARVGLDADGYVVAAPWDPALSTEVTYTFTGTGYARTVTLTGYDATGAIVASDAVVITITAASSGVGAIVGAAPYFYQYANIHEPGSTCGVTSAAMLIDTFHPDSVTPDDLYEIYGLAQGQSPAALAELYRAEGLHADATTAGTRAQIRAHLDAGRPVAAHGWWTAAGHVVLIIGYDADDWIVHDPAGDWSVCYACGEGRAVHYPLGGDWDARMGGDGEVWWSTGAREAF